MNENPLNIKITYEPTRFSGKLEKQNNPSKSVAWERIKTSVIGKNVAIYMSEGLIELAWPDLLDLLREFGSKNIQKELNFKFKPEGEAVERIKKFSQLVKKTRIARSNCSNIEPRDIETVKQGLKAKGFERELKDFQLDNLLHLLTLPNGANFSVPGAGKTTVTFALHLLLEDEIPFLFVVCPRSAFPAWSSIVNECMAKPIQSNFGASGEGFTVLDCKEEETERLLNSGARRFVMSYDLMIRQTTTISNFLATNNVHLVLDESHRMKAGIYSQRGAFLLSIAALPVRKDILSGTPMPQGPMDLASQLGFLWPGMGYDLKIQRGDPPRDVLGNLYVRTTKNELNLPPVYRHYRRVGMNEGHLAFYAVVRNEAIRQLVGAIKKGAGELDIKGARKSVMRLLQVSSNPVLALNSIHGDGVDVDSGIVEKVLEEGMSRKMLQVVEHTRDLAKQKRKVVIWSIFTNTINQLEDELADLNPVVIYGGTKSGSEEEEGTREYNLKKFHESESCGVLIANPAAAGEGISLHSVCHDAIYLDRSYVSTHYLQSIDRIHRLGLKPGIETNIYIYQTKAPAELGSIDQSVSRRLAQKIRGLQELLEDPDLHLLALDEENSEDPIDYDVDLQDLIDLVEELEGKNSKNFEEE